MYYINGIIPNYIKFPFTSCVFHQEENKTNYFVARLMYQKAKFLALFITNTSLGRFVYLLGCWTSTHGILMYQILLFCSFSHCITQLELSAWADIHATAQKKTVSQTQKTINHLDNSKLGSSNVESVNIRGKASEGLLQSVGSIKHWLDTASAH